jgi:hypothetical protein
VSDARRQRIADLRRIRDEADAEIRRLAREWEAEHAAEIAEALGARQTGGQDAFMAGLRSIDDNGTNEPTPMEAQVAIQSRAAKISGAKAARLKTSLPWQKALQLVGLSAQEWAAKQQKPPLGGEKARSWMKRPGRGGRPIPRFWAERIAKEFPDVPAVDASWPSGIRD